MSAVGSRETVGKQQGCIANLDNFAVTISRSSIKVRGKKGYEDMA